jgi:predicted metal-dependent hydrolase
VTEILQVGGQRLEVTYKPVKNLRLTVYPPDGRVKVSAPRTMTAEFIRNFAASRMAWIEKQQARCRSLAKNQVFDTGLQSPQLLWGLPHPFTVIEKKCHPKVVVESGTMTLYVRPGASGEKQREILDAWRLRLLKETASGLIEKWEGRIGVKIAALYVRKMKTHWGSCNCARQTIRLNSELVKRSPECLEFVVVHELIHLIEPGHNRNFYRLMDQHLSGWKEIRKRMNTGEI